MGLGVTTSCTIANSIIAGNGSKRDVSLSNSATLISLGGNVIGNIGASTGWVATDTTGNDANPLDVVLSPLGNFGGADANDGSLGR